jgi:ribonuclease HI
MPWRAALLKGTRVLARCNQAGDWLEDGGRVEVRYRASDPRAYRAAARNLTAEPGELLPDDHCVPSQPVPERDKPPARGGGKQAAEARKAQAAAAHQTPSAEVARFVAYSDGACSGNPGPCGLGVVLISAGTRRELSEYLGIGTNNIAELTAILRTLEALDVHGEPVIVHTDSQYAIGVLQKGWKPKANQELIAAIKAQMKKFSALRLVYVPGHAGVPLNERADELAREAVSSRKSGAWREVQSAHVGS